MEIDRIEKLTDSPLGNMGYFITVRNMRETWLPHCQLLALCKRRGQSDERDHVVLALGEVGPHQRLTADSFHRRHFMIPSDLNGRHRTPGAKLIH